MGIFDSKTQSTPNMPGYVKDLQKDVFKDLGKLYRSDYTGAYTKPSFASFSDPTKTAFDGLMTLAGNNSGENGMAPHLQSIMDSGGFTPGQTEAINSVRSLANNSGLNQIINDKNGMTQAQNRAYSGLQNTVYGNNATLQDTFNGGGLTDDQRGAMDRYTTQATTPFEFNEDFLKVRQSALDKQADALARRSAAAGRYGGGIDQAILAREQGDLTSRMNVDQMLNDQNQKNIANAALMAGGQQGTNTQLGINSAQQAGYQGIGSMGNMGVGQRSDAIGQRAGLESQIFNMENAGLDRMGQAYQTAQQPFMTQRAVGQEYENQQQKMIDDERRIQAEQDPFNRMQKYLGLINGTPMGTTSTTSPSWAQILAGGGLGVLGLGSMLGGFGSQPSTASSGGMA